MKKVKKKTIQQKAGLRVILPPNLVFKDKSKYVRKPKHRKQAEA